MRTKEQNKEVPMPVQSFLYVILGFLFLGVCGLLKIACIYFRGKGLQISSDFFFKILFIYSRETHREREAEAQAEGEAGSLQGT